MRLRGRHVSTISWVRLSRGHHLKCWHWTSYFFLLFGERNVFEPLVLDIWHKTTQVQTKNTDQNYVSVNENGASLLCTWSKILVQIFHSLLSANCICINQVSTEQSRGWFYGTKHLISIRLVLKRTALVLNNFHAHITLDWACEHSIMSPDVSKATWKRYRGGWVIRLWSVLWETIWVHPSIGWAVPSMDERPARRQWDWTAGICAIFVRVSAVLLRWRNPPGIAKSNVNFASILCLICVIFCSRFLAYWSNLYVFTVFAAKTDGSSNIRIKTEPQRWKRYHLNVLMHWGLHCSGKISAVAISSKSCVTPGLAWYQLLTVQFKCSIGLSGSNKTWWGQV